MRKTLFYWKRAVLIISVFGVFYCVQTIGTDTTDDLDYAPDELLVRFAPKANGQQLTEVEQNEVLSSPGGVVVKHDFKLVSGLCLVQLSTNST